MILRILRTPCARTATFAVSTGAATLLSCSETIEPDREDLVAAGEVRGAVRLADSGTTTNNILVRLWQDSALRKLVTSDPDGSFRFTAVPHGRYEIEFSAPDYRNERSLIELRDSLFEIAPVSLMRIRGNIRGMLFNEETGDRVAGARVTLMNGQESLSTTSASDGSFGFLHVAFGAWTLTVQAGSPFYGAVIPVQLSAGVLDIRDVLVAVPAAPSAQYLIYDTCAEGGYWDGCMREPGIQVVDLKDDARRVQLPTPLDAYDVAWAPGPNIAFIMNGNLVSMPPSGGTPTVLRAYSSPATARFPAWSPDGTRIAFIAITPPTSTLVIIRADGSDHRPILGDRAMTTPTWSPDGSHIAFDDCGTNACDITVVRADGVGATPLTRSSLTDELYFAPNWSPNDSRLAIMVCTQDCVIGLLDVNTRVLTRLPVHGSSPVWSPDGSLIALVADTDIVIIKPTGEELARIPAPTMFSGRVAWSP